MIIYPCIDIVLLGWMSSAIGVKQKQKSQISNMAVTKKLSFLMYCLCIAGDDCCNPCIKKEDRVEEHGDENYEIMTIRVKYMMRSSGGV